FSATKVAWLLDNVPEGRRRAMAGELAFGTVDSWLATRLTNGRLHVTDASNASRTLLFDIHEQRWDAELLELFDVPREVMPEVVATSGEVGVIESGPLSGVPLAAMVGDQQGATFGQACFAPGLAKNTYGTGCFVVLNTGNRPLESRHRLLTTVAWHLRNESAENGPRDRLEYALEGSIFMAGAVVQWLRDGLGIIRQAGDIEA